MEKNIKTYMISYDLNDPEPPKPHEQYAARIVSDYFESDIVFIRKKAGSSPDFIIVRSNQIWELKSPLGNGKRTIANNLREASHQSENVILDLSRCKMNNMNALARIGFFLKNGNAKFKRLLVIQKDKKILTYDVKKGKIIVG
ncbi:MAG: hypothetical protein Q4F58_03520 [Candidatus Saccharibacteria bacterium]|nr:hypothetical protein [Candidatus Saccharibacteria bacterium]